MNASEFYHCATLLLSRVGYVIDVAEATFKSRDEQELETQKWVDRAISGLELVSGVEVPWYRKNFFFEIDLTPEKQQQLKADWNTLTRDTPLSGLRYSNGLPLVFAARVADLDDPAGLVGLFERMHTEFLAFADEYMLGVARHAASVCALCFAFSDSEKFGRAKLAMNRRRSKTAYWRRTYTFAWLLDLNTFEIASTGGATARTYEALESLSPSIGRNREIKRLEDWTPPSKVLTSGTVGPKTFVSFARVYSRLLAERKIQGPDFRVQTTGNDEKRLNLRSELRGLEKQIQQHQLELGEVLFQRFRAGESLHEADPQLTNAAEILTSMQNLERKIAALGDFRRDWSNSDRTLTQLRLDSLRTQHEFAECCDQLGESIFKHEQELIKRDATLQEIYRIAFDLETEIMKRKLQIEMLSHGQRSLLEGLKANAQRLLWNGLNQKDEWSIGKHCRAVGPRVFQHGVDIPPSSQVFAIWDKATRVHARQAEFTIAVETEVKAKNSIEREVAELSEPTERDDYPWDRLDGSFRQKVEQLRAALSEPLICAARDFRLAGRSAESEPLAIEVTLAQLEERQKSLTDDLQKLEHT